MWTKKRKKKKVSDGYNANKGMFLQLKEKGTIQTYQWDQNKANQGSSVKKMDKKKKMSRKSNMNDNAMSREEIGNFCVILPTAPQSSFRPTRDSQSRKGE